MDIQRFKASILWFTSGFVEYKVINPLKDNQKLKMIDVTFELGSEFPGGNNVWPSNIGFSLNNVKLGSWLSPGDFVDTRGRYNPDWYSSHLNQYGTQVTLRITDYACWINGQQVSWNNFDKLNLTDKLWNFKISVDKDAENVGGCTIFGKGFGNFDHNLDFRFYYTDVELDATQQLITMN